MSLCCRVSSQNGDARENLIDDVPNWKRSNRTDQPPFRADSIEALAALCELSPEPLDATLKAYNAACPQGEFQPLRTESLATKGLDIVKSNWARPISTPPFYAYPIISGVCFTYGGVKTNSNGQARHRSGVRFPAFMQPEKPPAFITRSIPASGQ